MYSPVVVFTYNRFEEIMKVMAALAQNIGADRTDVYVFSNAPVLEVKGDYQKVQKIRDGLGQFCNTFHTYTVIYREKNEGSNTNMYDGICQVINKYGRVIVLEDDIVTAPAFLPFMNQALERFEDDEEVFSICGYNPVTMESQLQGDSFSYDVFRSWGWATWKRCWNSFSMMEDKDIISKIDLRKAHTEAMMYTCGFQRDIPYPENGFIKFLDYRLTRKQMALRKTVIYSKKSLCDNIGMDGNGLTTLECSTYCNENFDPKDSTTVFSLSKEKLDIDSDRNYFFKFRKEEFVVQAYEKTNFDRNTMYLNMYYGLSRLLAKKDVDRREVFDIYFSENGWKKVAIFGWGAAGKLLYTLLENTSVHVSYIIDRRDISREVSVPFFHHPVGAPMVDAMLITALKDFWDIEEQLYGQVPFPLISMDDVVNECLRKADKQEKDESETY